MPWLKCFLRAMLTEIVSVVGAEGLVTFALHIAACITVMVEVVVVLCVVVVVFASVSGRLLACVAVKCAIFPWVVRPCVVWSVGIL